MNNSDKIILHLCADIGTDSKFEYCPHEYGAPFTKRTALWGYFNIPQKPWWGINKPKGQSLVKDVITKMNCRDDNERMNKRSECYYPFAQAFFEANQ